MKFFNKRLPINSLEKFMLAHESETIAYNSQIVVEFDGTLNPKKFKDAIKKAVTEIPWLRTSITHGVISFNRSVLPFNKIDLSRALKVSDHAITKEELDIFCKAKFDLKNGHCFTFLIAPLSENRTQLIFNVHHTLCDAAGQFLILEEVFRLINGESLRPQALRPTTFRYRDLRNYMGWKWVIRKLWENRKSLKDQRKYKMASLVDYPEKLGRTVSSMTFDLTENQKKSLREFSKKHSVSTAEYITYNAFRAFDLSLKERGDLNTPIMGYIPKTLRSYFKIRYSFQNILSTVLIVGKRQEIHDKKFIKKIKHIIQSHKVEQASKFIFNGLLPCSVLGPKKLKNIFKDMDSDPESMTSSMLISAGRVPKSYTFPLEWKNIRLWARGTMLKSPGIWIIYTGTNDHETITIEYVKELTEQSTIESLKRNLIANLSSPSEAYCYEHLWSDASKQ